ncbi:chloride channel protein [Kitasatospora phosalacinea]|uniref:chloride channel protein n=1 Tax=Kitasatospora phosalacinea TaxID=2065 RepID=UPI0005253865|nr:chloride channel protein [Kitasatospora phosalacinea]
MPAEAAGASQPPGLRELLRSPGYGRLLLVSALIGVPVSLAAFGFVSLEHELQHWVWESLPKEWGYSRAPWWWPLPALALAGLLLAPIVTRMPGRGGHIPVHGLGGPPTLPVEVPSVVLAALAGLPLGAVLGPEAPLMALGSGLALLTVSAAKRASSPRLAPLLGTAGSTAAIATIFGSPLVAAVLVIEAAGLGGAQLTVLLLPCLLSSGVGALVFTGFGHWTGLSIGALSLPSVPRAHLPDAGDFLWGIPLAVVVAVVMVAGQTLGHRFAAFTAHRTAVRTVLCAVLVGACVAGYALATGRSPEEAALSGQATLGQLAADPSDWPVAALLALVLFKGLGWGVALGSLRGGPIFPAVLLGAALGVAAGGLPGLGVEAGLAAGISAAGAAVTRLPVTSTVLTTVLLGSQAADSMPLLIVASVVASVTAALVHRVAGPDRPAVAGPDRPAR